MSVRRRGSYAPGRQPPNRAGTDFAALRQRLDQLLARNQASAELSAQRQSALLRERASLLAKAAAPAQAAGATLAVAVWTLGGERYAIETRFVKQILRGQPLTPVPGAGELCAGVIVFQGELVPVFTPQPLFGLAAAPAEVSWIAVLGEQAPELGLLVDAAWDVAQLRREQLSAPPGSALRESWTSGLLQGVTADGLILINGSELLRDPRLGAAAPPKPL